jgi:hypothetical protein
MSEVWNVPGVNRPGFVARLGRSAAFLAVLLLDVSVAAVLAGTTTFGRHGMGFRVTSVTVSLLVDVGTLMLAFRVLTPKSIKTRCLVPGAVTAGVAWSILQYIGMALVILGLIALFFLAAQITLYAAETNVVWERHLWPRSIVQPPLTDADLRVLTDIAMVGERRPEQSVEVSYPSLGGGVDDSPSR